MINFEKFTLSNGLRVLVHQDLSSQVSVLNLMYDVGSRDEDAEKTGFAHLFEHLMFGGSKNIENFDGELQRAGGENNAFTSPDITNYYETVPTANLETAFWLESDRMMSLSFDPKVLEVQRKVVIEEFKQRYLSQPYGDVWLKLRPVCYEKHSYNWATIGKEIKHIEDATMDDVKDFFGKFYHPNNAVLVVGGNVQVDEVKALAEKWFGPIAAGPKNERNIPVEPKMKGEKRIEVTENVPSDALYKVYHMCDRLHPDYYATDLLSDILGRGKSSRLYQRLVQEEPVFSNISASIMGSYDPGLFVISGRLNDGFTLQEAEQKVDQVISDLLTEGVDDSELVKVKNQAESTLAFGRIDLLERCISLAQGELLGDMDNFVNELEYVGKISAADVNRVAKEILVKDNSVVMHYNKATSN